MFRRKRAEREKRKRAKKRRERKDQFPCSRAEGAKEQRIPSWEAHLSLIMLLERKVQRRRLLARRVEREDVCEGIHGEQEFFDDGGLELKTEADLASYLSANTRREGQRAARGDYRKGRKAEENLLTETLGVRS